jgi:N-acetylneuraminic acid mutarotase
VAGGVTLSDDGSLELARDILRFDAKTDSWEVIERLPKRAARLVAECIGSCLYIIAGDTGPTSEPERPIYPAICRDDVQILDLNSLRWHFGCPKPTPETGVTSAVSGASIYVVSSYEVFGAINAILEAYDTTQDKWTKAPNMPTPRTGVPAGFLDGKLYCVNGLGRGLVPLSLTEVFDPSTNAWEILNHAPPPCYSGAYVNVRGEELHIFGGRI